MYVCIIYSTCTVAQSCMTFKLTYAQVCMFTKCTRLLTTYCNTVCVV